MILGIRSSSHRRMNWPIGRESLVGSPRVFHCLVRSLQTEEVGLRQRIEEVVGVERNGAWLIQGNEALAKEL
jgi:hypothetical protein